MEEAVSVSPARSVEEVKKVQVAGHRVEVFVGPDRWKNLPGPDVHKYVFKAKRPDPK